MCIGPFTRYSIIDMKTRTQHQVFVYFFPARIISESPFRCAHAVYHDSIRLTEKHSTLPKHKRSITLKNKDSNKPLTSLYLSCIEALHFKTVAFAVKLFFAHNAFISINLPVRNDKRSIELMYPKLRPKDIFTTL